MANQIWIAEPLSAPNRNKRSGLSHELHTNLYQTFTKETVSTPSKKSQKCSFIFFWYKESREILYYIGQEQKRKGIDSIRFHPARKIETFPSR